MPTSPLSIIFALNKIGDTANSIPDRLNLLAVPVGTSITCGDGNQVASISTGGSGVKRLVDTVRIPFIQKQEYLEGSRQTYNLNDPWSFIGGQGSCLVGCVSITRITSSWDSMLSLLIKTVNSTLVWRL